MMGATKDISIIIPMYNGEKYIEECLNSILDESKENIEVIVVDDGSTDNSGKICEKYSEIKYYKNHNHGVSYSRNYGIKKAVGKYLMFVDCDDKLIKGWYNVIKKVIVQNDNDIIYFSQNFRKQIFTKKELIESIIGYNKQQMTVNMASACSKIYKTQYIKDFKVLFEKDIINGEDLLFNLNALIHTNDYLIINQSIYQYRLNYSSATHRYNPSFFSSNTSFINKLSDILIENNIKNEQVMSYVNFCLLHSIEIFIYKISLIKNKNSQRQAIRIFEEKIYKDYINNFQSSNQCSLFLNKLIKLIAKKKYRVAIYLMKLKNTINKLRKRKQKKWEVL